MEKVGFIFPGQGAQHCGMGKDFFDNFEEARDIYSLANDTLGVDLADICFRGPDEKLNATDICQPAILTTSLAILSVFKKRYGFDKAVPSACAGLSLGEFTALVSADALAAPEAIRLVRRRGTFMQECCSKYPGAMAAVMGMEEEEVSELCRQVSSSGYVSTANLNCPGQIVISGSREGVRSFMEAAQKGNAKIVELKVAGAFHSELMKDAAERLGEELKASEIRKPAVPVIANVDACVSFIPDEIRAKLVRQLSNPVLWQKCMQTMIGMGITKFYEIGPGKVLAGLGRRIDRSVKVVSINSIDSLKEPL